MFDLASGGGRVVVVEGIEVFEVVCGRPNLLLPFLLNVDLKLGDKAGYGDSRCGWRG